MKPKTLQLLNPIPGGTGGVPGDWNQNDSTQPDYIKNRTHWEENDQIVIEWDGNTDGKDTVSPNDSLTLVKVSDELPDATTFIGKTLYLSNGNSFTVTSDGIMDADDMYGIAASGSGTPWIYGILTPTAGGITFPSTGLYTPVGDVYFTKVELGSATVYQLDEKFIPDAIARISDIPEPVKPDWSQNDSTQPDYVGNRTHWVVRGGGQYVATEELDIKIELPNGHFKTNSMGWNNPYAADGDVWTVVFNRTSYLCPCQIYTPESDYYTNYWLFGNLELWGDAPATLTNEGADLPFLVKIDEDTSHNYFLSVFALGPNARIVPFEMYNGPSAFFPLDEKLIPDTIARKSDALPLLPIGGDELGGVKNGGNVVINEDGTMTAPAVDAESVSLDTTLTVSGAAADAKAVGDALGEKLSNSGGTLTGKFIIPSGNAAVGFINDLDMKIFGYGSGYFRIGDSTYPAQLRGSGTNPLFNDKKILIEGDIVNSPLTVETVTVDEDGDDSGTEETVAVTGLSLDLTSYSATVGDGFYINPVITPSDATNKAVTWKSSAMNNATVNSSGYVECIAEGTAIITCTTVDGGFTASCTVRIAAADSGETEVTLSSISATYSGGDVAVGTALTDLTGIVVTATYSDGSTETVTDYTLSGTIAEGSNTVTVSYGGKTANFTVTGVAESSGGMVQLSTLGIESGLLKADGATVSLSSTYHVAVPYTDGMSVSTGMNGGWNTSTYPPFLMYDGSAYSAPGFTKADSTTTVGGKAATQFTATLTGYSENAVVYVNIYSGDVDGSVETAMNNSGIYYYIPGGEN